MKKSKQLLSMLLVVAMMVSMIPSALAAEFAAKRSWSDDLFTDVPAGRWFYQTVKTAYELELMSGYGNGTFLPEGNITLAETVTIAARIHAMATDAGELVQSGTWYRVYVDYALENGILTEELSDYNRAATRLEFAKILAKALPAEDITAINKVDDGMIPDVAEDEDVYLLYRAGVLTGFDEQGTFYPNDTILRCQVAAIVARMAIPSMREKITLTHEVEVPEVGAPETEQPETEEPETEEPAGGNADVLDENNALTVPFDQAYPDLFATGEYEYSGEQILIKMEKEPTGEQQAQLQRAGVVALEHVMDTINAKWYKAFVDGNVNEVMENVRALSFVLVAEYDYVIESDTIIECAPDEMEEGIKGNDLFAEQWYLRAGGIKGGWEHLKTPHKRPHYDEDRGECYEGEEEVAVEAGRGIIVAVIDTGVDYNHEDLKDNIWVNLGEIPDNYIDDDGNGYIDDYYGWNAVADRGSAMDDQGHGTHVAGIIAAANNNIGIVGIAYNATIMPIKAGMASGYFNSSDIAEAIIYAYQNGADVINMSFGGSASTILVQDALEAAYTRCVLVAAAGNDGMPNEVTDYYPIPLPSYPAALSYVLGVMSVGQNGVESAFSNWDAWEFNGVEYEVYAPGEAMISTIPNNNYATWNGTSMATPVVSAVAALLRSEFRDANTYPTKFIYGQICGTGTPAICRDPQLHTVMGMPHNVPNIVNAYNALTVMPTPDVGVTNYTVFDTVGLNGNPINDGDGVIDAGETIAIGFLLRNQWGKSTDTTITVNANSPVGIADPYITIHNPSVNIGEVGTYSTNDCGKIMENDAFVGWENPIYITIDPDCPNDYIFTLNVTVTCGNGLDAEDTAVYANGVKLNLTVRRGIELPNIIREDMTLTADQFYIIPNATVIMEGVTVTVEPGTQIQFWGGEEQDAYGTRASAYLQVGGTLLCLGEPDNRIRLFPSDLMDAYRVEIRTVGNGSVALEYTDVINPYLICEYGSSYALGCHFSQNYLNSTIYYRELNDGVMEDCYWDGAHLHLSRYENCSFRLLGSAYYDANFYGYFDGCLFMDCAADFNGVYENCVFNGNNNYRGEDSGSVSALLVPYLRSDVLGLASFAIDPDTGTTYLQIERSTNSWERSPSVSDQRFAESLGGYLVSINTQAELDFLVNRFGDFGMGLRYVADEGWIWADGTTPGAFFPMDRVVTEVQTYNYGYADNAFYGFFDSQNHWTDKIYMVIEIPGSVVNEITLTHYEIRLAPEDEYLIEATVAPATMAGAQLIYESEDPSIATVDENGCVTAVAFGTTVIRVYAPDRGVYNTLNVTVAERIALESIDLGGDFSLDIGKSRALAAVLIPANTSMQKLVYTSSDETVVSVSRTGVVTARGMGSAVITATNPESGVSASVVVTVIIPVTEVVARENTVVVDLTSSDTVDVLGVSVFPANATNQELVWTSSNPEILDVDADGNLIKNFDGSATLRATAHNGLYAEVTVCLTEMDASVTVKQIQRWYQNGENTVALLSDGTLWRWGKEIRLPQQMTDFAHIRVKQFALGNSMLLLLDDTGVLNVYQYTSTGSYDNEKNQWVYTYSWDLQNEPIGGVPVRGVTKIAASDNGSYYYLRQDGSIWVWGNNYSGQLGIANNKDQDTAVQMNLFERATDVVATDNGAAVLTESGKLYIAGDLIENNNVPALYAEGVVAIRRDGTECLMIDYGMAVEFPTYSRGNLYKKTGTKMVKSNSYWSGDLYIGDDGLVYARGYNEYGQLGNGTNNGRWQDEYLPMEKVTNVSNIFLFEKTVYIQTANGEFYGVGGNDNYSIPNLTTGNQSIPSRIFFGLQTEQDAPALESINLTGADISDLGNGTYVLDEQYVVLDYDQALVAGPTFAMIKMTDSSGMMVGLTRTFALDKVMIAPMNGFVVGETYTLTIPAAAFSNKFGVDAGAIELTFVAGDGAAAGTGTVPGGDSGSGGDVGSVAPGEVPEEVVNQTQKNPDVVRFEWTNEAFMEKWGEFTAAGYNTLFFNNAILNRLTITNAIEKYWLRISAREIRSVNGEAAYLSTGIGGNYWGTTNPKLIDAQILDFDDLPMLIDLVEGEYLTEAPSNVWPFAVDAWLENSEGERVDVIGNEKVTFCVRFNRAMDTTVDLDVRFGSYYPYADYEIDGEWVSDTVWKGTTTLTTLIEAGYQYWSIDNGRAADNAALVLYKDCGRFSFEIDTSSALAMNLQGNAGDEGITLTWTQDDFDTLMGYNVYRADQDEDAFYQRINTSIIPNGTNTFFDNTVEPGKVYYYIFTVVKTDFTESEPSGKIRILSKDTMAPDLYHTPVYSAYAGSNIVINATASDNLELASVKLFYRTTGTQEWTEVAMSKLNDRYSAVITGDKVTLSGIEYYIVASDGVNTTRRDNAGEPFSVLVQEDPGEQMMGDVNGDGRVTVLDALRVLRAINGKVILTKEEFFRADLDGDGKLSAAEALRILKYANGEVGSLKMN